jgi:hypothetical protein
MEALDHGRPRGEVGGGFEHGHDVAGVDAVSEGEGVVGEFEGRCGKRIEGVVTGGLVEEVGTGVVVVVV